MSSSCLPEWTRTLIAGGGIKLLDVPGVGESESRDGEAREPGPAQRKNIEQKCRAVSGFFGIGLSKVVPVSANERYNLARLVDEIVFALPDDKKITFLRQTAEENVSSRARREAVKGTFQAIGEEVGGKLGKLIAGELGRRVGGFLGGTAGSILDGIGSIFGGWW